MTRPFFTRDRISHFDIFDRHAEDAIRHMKARFREGHPLDFQDLVSRFTLDSATEFLFGKDVESLSATLPYPFYSNIEISKTHASDKFANAFGAAQLISSTRMRFSALWPLFEFWNDKALGHTIMVREIMDPILKEAIAKKKAKGDAFLSEKEEREVQENETVLDHLVNYTDGTLQSAS